WHGVTLNKPTVLANGDWILPVSLNQHYTSPRFRGVFPELDSLRGAHAFVSSDQGATWKRRGMVKSPHPSWHEHMFVEREDGSIWMPFRTSKGMMESLSEDGGKTWTKPTFPTQIRHPASRFFVRRLDSGKILLIKHGDK